jgi:hypothetical protein
MALSDGIRRNVADISDEERGRLQNAIIQLHKKFYPGGRNDTPTGGVSYWFKQDEIHAHTHVVCLKLPPVSHVLLTNAR